MKQFLVIICVVLMASCKGPQYAIGMHKNEFLAVNKKVVPFLETEDECIYKIWVKPLTDFGYWKVFYFKGNYLRKVDLGNRPADVIVEERVR